jgi:hypothetical protein
LSPARRINDEIQKLEPISMQLVNHETNNALALLGDHPNAVALAQNAQEFFLGPREVVARLLDTQHLGHVAPDHPADVDANG